jgi:Hg(II)-responsive transcriptional regulator
MKIGEVAALAGVPVATVRYYERRGLIADAKRTPSGYRQYDAEAARRLRFIKHAQELGFSLDEIQQMLALKTDDPASCARVQSVTRERIRAVRERLAELERLERTLQDLVRACERHAPTAPCPVLVVLRDDAGAPPSRRRTGAHA